MHIKIILTLMITAIASFYAPSEATIPIEMLNLMNPSVSACDDFYEYSCGGWMMDSLTTSGVQLQATFDVIRRNNWRVFVAIIEENFPFVGDFWHSCINMDKITELGNKPLQEDLKRIYNAKSKTDILTLAGAFSRTGRTAFVNFMVIPDPKDATTNILSANAAKLTLPSTSLYSNAKFHMVRREYYLYINELLQLSGFIIPDSSGDLTSADIVIKIEQTLSHREHMIVEAGHISIADASQRWPIAVAAFLKGLTLEKTVVKDESRIYIDFNYFDYIEKFIQSFSTDDLKVYLAYVMVHSRVQWLGKDFFRIWFKFFGQKLKGQRFPPQRSTICMNSLLENMPDLFGEHYYRKAFDTKREEYALQMVELIKESLGNRISRSSWLNSDEKEQSKTKLNKVITLLGQSTTPKTNPPVMSRENYPSNLNSILSHSFDAKLKEVGKPVNRMEWAESSAKLNAHYNRRTNTIRFPAAILQPPIFNGAHVHPARNFGAIGPIMGHELLHGFDSNGHLYDGDGNENPLWSGLSTKEFESHAECIKDQYSSFKVMGEFGDVGKVNGTLTLNENIADNGGFVLAWDAYRKYMIKVNPNTDKAMDRMFFIAYGQTHCSKTPDKVLRKNLITSLHAPDKWRVNGVIMNSEEFATVFDCKTGTRMNPKKKCRLW